MAGHSRLGASGAHRWMTCPGSVSLSELVTDKSSEFADEGTHAHAVAAWCLEGELDAWEAIGWDFEGMVCTQETADAVQVYLDYVRAIPETKNYVHVVDYKHGIGVQVDVEDNPQLMYYGIMALERFESGIELQMSQPDIHPDMYGTADYVKICCAKNLDPSMMIVRLHVVQPRGFHPDGPCRHWDIQADKLLDWCSQKLIPAMNRVNEPGASGVFNAGEHCRFCPAKLVCPQLLMFYDEMQEEPLAEMSDDELAKNLNRIVPVKTLIKAMEAEGYARLAKGRMQGKGWKLVQKSVDRVWKDGAKAEVEKVLKDKAYQPGKIVSPAQAEKLPGGKKLAAEWAYKPTDNAGLTLAPESDRREAQTPETASDAFQELLSN